MGGLNTHLVMLCQSELQIVSNPDLALKLLQPYHTEAQELGVHYPSFLVMQRYNNVGIGSSGWQRHFSWAQTNG
jgi:hypothetical protein